MNKELAGKLRLSLERHEIRKMVITAAIDRKNALKEELSDKLVFLKMDGCKRRRVSYFAINVQFINSKNMLNIKTLVARDTQAQHSSVLDEMFDSVWSEIMDYNDSLAKCNAYTAVSFFVMTSRKNMWIDLSIKFATLL